MQKRDPDSAIVEFQAAVTVDNSPAFLAGLARAFTARGWTAKADSMIQHLLAQPYPPACDIALIYVSLGKKDQALHWLQQAYDDRNEGLVWLKGDPRVGLLRSDLRFTSLLQKLSLDH